jgi:hypothetical protein
MLAEFCVFVGVVSSMVPLEKIFIDFAENLLRHPLLFSDFLDQEQTNS